MKKFAVLIVFILCCHFMPHTAWAQVKCVQAEGESVIVNHDTPSARLEAVARAKWTAIEQVVGTEVKAGSFVQNFTLVEDVIKTGTGGFVKSYQVLGEDIKEDVLTVRVRACVEPSQARDAVSQLGLNNAITLFIPARKPGRAGDEFEETNILSETLIARLLEQGYTVTDAAPTHAVDARAIEKAVRSGSTLSVRSLMYKFLANLIIIGKVDYTLSTKKGEDIGYGLSMPFHNVTVRLTYRILAKNKAGRMEILAAGVEEAGGLANSREDAAARAMKDLADKLSPALLDQVGRYIKGQTRKVSVRINGITDPETVLKVKAQLQSIVWVTDVEEKQMGSYLVSYPENTLYLANSIKQKGNFRLVNFSPYSLDFDYTDN